MTLQIALRRWRTRGKRTRNPMSAALRNRLRRVEKELAVREAASEGQLLQIQKAALASLSDGDLCYLRVGGCPAERLPVASYRAAGEAAAVRFAGRSCPALELSSDAVAQEIANRSGSKLHAMFLDEGPYRRELYPRHMEFLTAGGGVRARLFVGGDRTGQNQNSAGRVTCHLPGRYPAWWRGKRFDKPVNAWACGTTNGTTRDIVQDKLLGTEGAHGAGMIPAHMIVKVSNKQGLPNAADTVLV